MDPQPASSIPSPAQQVAVQRLPTHIPVLDGLRGIAILMVLLSHVIDGRAANHGLGGQLIRLTQFGWVGVDLFFALSGFLITGILVDSRHRPHHFRNFYARRTLRIFPLYYGVLFVVFAAVPLFGKTSSAAFQLLQHRQAWLWFYGSNVYCAFTATWPFASPWVWMGHFWSLAVEEHFYLIWPAIVFLCPTSRRLITVCGIVILGVWAARFCCWMSDVNGIAQYVFTPLRIDALVAGGLAAALVRRPSGIRGAVLPCVAAVTISLRRPADPFRHSFGY